MEFVNEFTVPVGVDRAFEILTDLERVAPCLPGAVLEEVDGDAYTGKVKVKVGPISVTYRGTAEVTEKDADTKHAVIHATGREARGSGTAAADVTADLVAAGEDTTEVTVVTDLTITGKPAQFGRGVMQDVGTKLIGTFADRLAAMVEGDEDGAGLPDDALPPPTAAPTADTPPTAPPDAPVGGTGPRRLDPPAQEPEALDLMEVAGGAITKRLVPVAALVALVVALVWWRRRSR
ncbi:SRPBCC family protein [Nitriliruptor alkaliphilus]|uniref:SRPBCC family protein n=1 Tax=Nitriliruptor alkaliphilus TaxID=427918 RepID=UPI0006976286|nr:SRPBCC family protein [Nitriliruptor alkaliphilus]